MVHEDADPTSGTGLEVLDDLVEIVHTLEVFNNYAFHTQVVSPDPLDQLGIVPALDEDTARQRNTGAGIRHRERPRCGPCGRRRLGPRCAQSDGLTVDEEPGAQREQPDAPVSVLQLHEAVLDSDDCPHEAGGYLLDDKVAFRLHDGGRDAGCPPSETSKYIRAVAIVIHPPRLAETPVRSAPTGARGPDP